jgi:hypothetical protein
MFILKRQDVEISSIQHPKKDQQIPILSYCGQTFRLISVFESSQSEDARAFWRDLTDNQGKACVLLEEPERYSVWGKIRLETLASGNGSSTGSANQTLQQSAPKANAIAVGHMRAGLLMLQAIYIDIEDLLGSRQANLFEKDLTEVLLKGKFPQITTPGAVKSILSIDPLQAMQLPAWQESHFQFFLQELHRLGKAYFGGNNFAPRAMESLQDLAGSDLAAFKAWLKLSAIGRLWM